MGPIIGLAWGVIWLLFWGVMVLSRRRERMRTLDIVEQTLREGRPVPPELLRNTGPFGPRRPVNDLRVGLILIAIGLGLLVGGLVNFYTYSGPHPQMFYGPFGLFPIPTFLGLAFLVMHLTRKDDPDR